MKKIILTTAILLASLTASAARPSAPADTVAFPADRIQRIVSDTTTTTTGRQRIQHYVLTTDRELYKITATTLREIQLARRHGALLRLALIPQKKKIISL